MRCATCGTTNPAQARFCMGCGILLINGSVCSTCHTLLPPEARYCYHCGTFLAQAAGGNGFAPPVQAVPPAQTAPLLPTVASAAPLPVTPVPPPAPASPGQAAQPPAVSLASAPTPGAPTPAAALPGSAVRPVTPAEILGAVTPSSAPAASQPAAPLPPAEPASPPLPSTASVQEILPSLKRFLPLALYEPLERRPNQRQLEAACSHLIALLETTKTYLPRPVIVAPQPAGVPAGGMYRGVFLFGDVSGFTPLSEQLKKEGQAGAEKITQIINSLFTELVKVLFDHGGILLKFGGDAMLGLFAAESDAEMARGALRAAQAGLAMQAVMQQEQFSNIQAGGESRKLMIKCGISAGPYFAAHIGTRQMMAYVTTGHTVNRAEQAEGHANPGDVVMTREVYDLLGGDAPSGEVAVGPVNKDPEEGFFLVQSAPPLAERHSHVSVHEPPDGDVLFQIGYLVQRMRLLAPYLSPELINRIVTNPGNPRISPDHRQVTVMFANYVGISDLIEDIGSTHPELIVQHLNNYFVHMAEVVERYEGTLARMDQYAVGDRLVIFFGAPRAHEDDPVRAVYTALDMQKAVYDSFAALQTASGIYRFRQRIGINTGHLFAGNAGAPNLRQEYTLMGDDINMAARLMSKAGWQEIFISRKTRERVAAFFDMEDKGELKVKGKEIRIPTFKVLRRRGEVGKTRGLEGRDSPLIGRTDELAALQKACQGLLGGRSQIMALVGDSGLGKSRLTAEMKSWFYSQEGADQVRWVSAQALSFGEHMSYWLASQFVRSALNLGPEDRQEDVLFNLWEQAEQLLGKETARETVPFLANLMNLELTSEWATWVKELDPKVRQKQTFWAAREFFAAAASQRPMLMVFDDLHWADEATLALLEDLLSITDQAPVMFLFILRPLRQKGSWQLRSKADSTFHHRFSEVALSPLTREQSQELLAALLPGAVFSADILNQIFEKSAGNPFYLEEVVRSLIDSGAVVPEESEPDYLDALIRSIRRKPALEKPKRWKVDPLKIQDIRVPETLHGAIIARIDRLTEDARQALQMAAVIGRQFRMEVLCNTAQAENEVGLLLAQLERNNFIRAIDNRLDMAYIFPDALVQEVAYENLLMQRRQEFHLKVGRAMEDLLGERAPQDCELLAHHFSRSNDVERAIRYLELAGIKAQAEFANATAVQHYTRLLELLGEGEESWAKRTEVLHRRQQVYALSGKQEARQADLNALLALAQSHQDEARRANALNGLADLYQWTGRYPEAIQTAQEALEIATRLADPAGQAAGLHVLGVVNYYRGDYEQARQPLERAVSLRREIGDQEGEIWSLMYLCMMHFMQGDYTQAIEHNRHALQVSEARQDWFQMGIHLTNAGRISLRLGEYETALAQLEQSLEMKTRVGDLIGQGFAHFAMGLAQTYLECYDQAEAALQKSLELRRQSGDRRGASYSLHGLGLVALQRGQYPQAEKHLQQAHQARRDLGLKAEVIADLSYLGQVYLRQDRLEEALQSSEQAIALLAQNPHGEEVQGIYLNHYRVLEKLGDPAAGEFLEKARGVMNTQAERISSPEMRQTFLERVRVNREILNA